MQSLNAQTVRGMTGGNTMAAHGKHEKSENFDPLSRFQKTDDAPDADRDATPEQQAVWREAFAKPTLGGSCESCSPRFSSLLGAFKRGRSLLNVP